MNRGMVYPPRVVRESASGNFSVKNCVGIEQNDSVLSNAA